MVQAVRAFNDDPDARVLVLTGDEVAFCAGADLTSLESLRPRVGKPEGLFGVRRFSPKPAIAAISGWCLGAGVTLASWCDLRIAADTARFGFPDRQWGVPILDGGGEHVTRALEIAERIASFPQATLLADRWGLLEDLDERMESTAQRDVRTLKDVAGDAEQASERFTSGGQGG
jgi:enoyl-CoA hydratase